MSPSPFDVRTSTTTLSSAVSRTLNKRASCEAAKETVCYSQANQKMRHSLEHQPSATRTALKREKIKELEVEIPITPRV